MRDIRDRTDCMNEDGFWRDGSCYSRRSFETDFNDKRESIKERIMRDMKNHGNIVKVRKADNYEGDRYRHNRSRGTNYRHPPRSKYEHNKRRNNQIEDHHIIDDRRGGRNDLPLSENEHYDERSRIRVYHHHHAMPANQDDIRESEPEHLPPLSHHHHREYRSPDDRRGPIRHHLDPVKSYHDHESFHNTKKNEHELKEEKPKATHYAHHMQHNSNKNSSTPAKKEIEKSINNYYDKKPQSLNE